MMWPSTVSGVHLGDGSLKVPIDVVLDKAELLLVAVSEE